MKSYLAHLTEERRLVILRILADLPQYCANTSTLHSALQHLGHAITRDEVRTIAAWLDEQGLAKVEPVPGVDGLLLLTLTERGGDIAAGRGAVPGVRKPGPR